MHALGYVRITVVDLHLSYPTQDVPSTRGAHCALVHSRVRLLCGLRVSQ